MEGLLKLRKPLRQSFSMTASVLEVEISKVDVEIDKLHILNSRLQDKFSRLDEVHGKISNLLLNANDENEFLTDFEANEEYRDKYVALKAKAERKMADSCPKAPNLREIPENSQKRNFKLPKLELQKFNGETRNWLGFWGQFKKIDEDKTIDDDDKFQYLVQATVVGSPARELIESYPPSGKNYKEAIKQLKSRFARDELLVEIYVRELLALVLAQVSKDENMTLSNLYDRLETQLRALETLGVKSDIYSAMLYPLVESALPEEILRAWERSRQNRESIAHTENLENLLNFLRIEVESEERLQLARTGFSIQNKADSVPATAACLQTGDRKKKVACIWCDKVSHTSSDCFKVHNLSQEDKKNLLRKKKACFSCLRVGHSAQKCKGFVKCLFCNQRHVTMMCPELKGSKGQKMENSKNVETSEVLLSNHKMQTTLLQTVLVKLVHNGKSGIVRVLFDSGAQRSYLRQDIVEKLGLTPIDEETISHNLFGGIETEYQSHGIFDIGLRSLDGKFDYEMTVLNKRKICGYIPRIKSEAIKSLLRKHRIKLNDLGNDTPDIGLLIGADYSGQLLTNNIIPLNKNLVAIETKLGWTLQGPVRNTTSLMNMIGICNLDLTDLWNLETIGIKDPADVKSKADLDVEIINFFRENIKVVEGRYEVCLPWKDGHPVLADSKDKAEKRLVATTRRLQRLGYFEEYGNIFRDWYEQGIIEIAPDDGLTGHYLPHQAVIKNSSLTTKIRPVFDASAKDEKGNCLNACLEKGLNLMEMIPKFLIQFRKHAIGVTSDIEKAFLQIGLSAADRDFLKFLWWKDVDQNEIITYRHCRVVFGISSSPFLLGATISYHLDNAPENLRETALQLKKSFYVDNCVISFETEEEVYKFKEESQVLMSSAGFDLRGWIAVPFKSADMTANQEIVSILGISWDIENDELYCNLTSLTFSEGVHTKRSLLSVSQRIFDPIGFTSPTTLIPKVLLQKTWKMKLTWDEELPPDIEKEFQAWLRHLEILSHCRIPRRLLIGPFEKCSITLHCFSDASKLAYAACVFLRASYEGKTSVQLVLSKSRVAPAKEMTIPRLELMGALIATRLYCQVIDALKLVKCKAYFWSDSTVSLTWIKREYQWNVFVGNRVKEIKEYTNPEDWHFVPGSLNPADLPSRGCNATTLQASRWWEGPDWLKEEQEKWPTFEVMEVDEKTVNSEKRKNVISSVSCSTASFTDRLTHFSSYLKNVRMVAWMIRFFNNSRHGKVIKCKELTSEEVAFAERTLLRLIQTDSFCTSDKKALKGMQTFKDENGLIRVKTKLILSEEDEDFKCPILLPRNHPLVHHLIIQRHRQLQHAGISTLICNLRENYWIIGVRRLVKKICSKCIICKRFKGKSVDPPFAPLPKNRTRYAGVFEVTGIDLAGPLYILPGEKVWIVIFTCAIYRAVHFEVTRSLSTDSFIMALRRFIARRGRVSIIYTDNGTNFVGTKNALNGLDWEKILEFSTIEKIKWNFNPPTAAWWGGFWERMVRMLKELLRRVLGQRTVSYVELETILFDCEATMNSRPLTYVEETAELKPLTPAHFIQGIPHNQVRDLDVIDSNSLNRRLRYLQKLRSDLRSRFRSEYLAMLVHKGQRRGETLQKGDIVLVGTAGKRINWPLGLIIEIFPGTDGHVRVVKVKTAEGERIRPVQNLFPLEVSCSAYLHEDFHPHALPKAESSADPAKSEVPTSSDCQRYASKTVDNQAKSSIKGEMRTTTRVGRQVRVPKRLDL